MQLAALMNKPTKPVRVIALSPLARIFQPYQSASKFLQNAMDIALDESPFDVVIEGAAQTHIFEYGKIYLIDEQLAKAWIGDHYDTAGRDPKAETELRKNPNYEAEQQKQMLTRAARGGINGPARRDYDFTGLVYFDVPRRISAALEYATETGEPLPEKVQKELEEQVAVLTKASNERVLGHARRLYNTLRSSRQKLRENQMEPADPNDMELLIAAILAAEVKREGAARKHLIDAFSENEKVLGERMELIK